METISKLLAAMLATAIACFARAQVVEPVDKNKIANGGYDVVAYFTNNAAIRGNGEYAVIYKGVKYEFTTLERQRLFKSDPERYLPACDGYCAFTVAAKGKKMPVNPQTFKIINGKLYLFFNGTLNGTTMNALHEWNKNERVLLEQLPGNWAKLKK